MVFRHEQGESAWVDLEQPTSEEVREVAREFGIGERLEAEVLAPSPFPLVASEGNAALLVLHFPALDATQEHGQEVDFIVGRQFIITVRYEVVAPLHRLRKLLEAEVATSEHAPLATDVLLEVLFAHLYASVRDEVSHTASRLDRVEDEMFEGNEHRTVRPISDLSREFLHLESGLANQEEPLARFLKALVRRGIFGPSFAERSERISAERAQVARLIHTHRAVATELRETNAVLLEARQNGIMKTLTIITVIILPLELIAALFDLRVADIPFTGNPLAFWLILGIMAALGLSLTAFFLHKRWL